MYDVCCEQESVHYFKYKPGENVLYEYADDIAPRHLTATLPLDYDTVAAADKFGNIFVTRLPPDVSSQASLLMKATLARASIQQSHCKTGPSQKYYHMLPSLSDFYQLIA